MTTTKQIVADRIASYLHHETTIAELVAWAEDTLMAGHFPDGQEREIAEVLARLGVADVQTFGLAWEDCEELLKKLGYVSRVEVIAV